ncbi:hypothetical protein EDF69_003913 [Sphingomonas sp. JUb134]|nr:hypothetical protein [Sphingomonas sp. JUb134]
MSFVESNDTLEVSAGPIDDLLQPRRIAPHGAQGRIAYEQHTLIEGDRLIDFPVGKWLNVTAEPTQRRPIAARIFEERGVLGDPDIAATALQPVVEYAGRNLASLAGAGAVAKKESFAISMTVLGEDQADALFVGFEVSGDPLSPGVARIDNVLCLEAAAGFGQQISMRRQPSARHAI